MHWSAISKPHGFDISEAADKECWSGEYYVEYVYSHLQLSIFWVIICIYLSTAEIKIKLALGHLSY